MWYLTGLICFKSCLCFQIYLQYFLKKLQPYQISCEKHNPCRIIFILSPLAPHISSPVTADEFWQQSFEATNKIVVMNISKASLYKERLQKISFKISIWAWIWPCLPTLLHKKCDWNSVCACQGKYLFRHNYSVLTLKSKWAKKKEISIYISSQKISMKKLLMIIYFSFLRQGS